MRRKSFIWPTKWSGVTRLYRCLKAIKPPKERFASDPQAGTAAEKRWADAFRIKESRKENGPDVGVFFSRSHCRMIYLLRHGEIEQSEEKRFVGQADLPLNNNGLRQARWW